MAEDTVSQSGSGSPSPVKLMVIMIIGAILLVAVSMGGVFFLLKSMGMLNPGAGGGIAAHGAKDDKAPPIYHPLEPAFVVNFKDRGRNRFLQVEIQVMSRDQEMITELTKHMPVIRNNLLILLSSQSAENLQSQEGKETLRATALLEINRFMEEQTGEKDVIEALYFTSFVMQ